VDGKRIWRFETIPQPPMPEAKTWLGDTWKYGGGGTWLTGSYDHELKTLYWAVGNPAPSFNAEIRKGDNLWTNSVVALDPETGKLKWHYQFTPNDSHDWDSVQDLILADQVIDGRPRKLLLHADRNGHFYVLDRTNGQFLNAWPFAMQNWADGFDRNGRPIVRPESVATPEGSVVFPSPGGATNFQAPSYDARSSILYFASQDSEGYASYSPAQIIPGRLYTGARQTPRPTPTRWENRAMIKALDTRTGKTLWDFPVTRGSLSAGVLGTRGGVVFAATAEGTFVGLDMANGQPLWRFRTGGQMNASPMSYGVNGQQFVAISAGNTVYSFALPQTGTTQR
jgi:alcohol dehydrogenase (cytochrome c)